jgi:biopolymer transport protein ExbB
MPGMADDLMLLMSRGGPVMWPLLAISIASLALIIERCWFWASLHRPAQVERLARLNDQLRRGDRRAAMRLIEGDSSPYGEVAARMLDDGAGEAVAIEAVDLERPRFDRFMVTLSTIITAAPMLGILGTVTGIIQSFNLLGESATLTDPRDISGGIAEALITTAFGLIIALMTLFPYMAFRGQVERALSRLESLVAAAQQGETVEPAGNAPETSPGTGPGPRTGTRATRAEAEPALRSSPQSQGVVHAETSAVD